MAPPQGRKKSQGRRKIEMELIADENARTVTFSKRRAGIFKKATELSILCGAQIAVIIFSLTGRAYSFGHPNVDSVVGCFFNRNQGPNPPESGPSGLARAAMLTSLKREYEQKNRQLEALRKRGKELQKSLENSGGFTDKFLSGLGYDQLNNLKEKLLKMRDDMLALQAERVGPSLTSGSLTGGGCGDEKVVVGETDLVKVEKEWRGVTGIPADWLKL